MSQRVDKLLEAIGKVDEKYIEASMSNIGTLKQPISVETAGNAKKGKALYSDKPIPKKQPFPFMAVIGGGLAASLVITAAVLAIVYLGPGKIDISGTGNTSTTAATADTSNSTDITTDTRTELMEKFPEYFNCSAFKGLEVYAWKDQYGLFKFGLMSGTNRNKTDVELDALPPASADEMREILNYYKEQAGSNELFVVIINRDTGTMDETRLRELLGLLEISSDTTTAVPDTIPTETEEYPIEDIRHYKSLENASEQNGLPYLDPDSTESIRGLSGICFLMEQVGDMWVYLVAEDVFADKDDPDLFYGRLEAVMTLPGSYRTNYSVDIVEDIENTEGAIRLSGTDYYVYPFRRSEIRDFHYFYVFSFMSDIYDGNLIANVLMTAYGDKENGYLSRFYILKEEGAYGDQIVPLGIKDELNATTGTDILLSDDIHWSVPPEMSLLDSKKDLKLTFAPETKIVVVTRANNYTLPDAVVDDEPETIVLPPDTEDEDVTVVDPVVTYAEPVSRTFEIQEQRLRSYDPNPGENGPWHYKMVFDSQVYGLETFEIDSEKYLETIKEVCSYYDEQKGEYVLGISDELEEALAPFISDGDLKVELLEKNGAYEVGKCVGLLDNREYNGTFYMISADYILGTTDDGRSFFLYKKDETEVFTNFRRIIEILWENHKDFPDMSAVVVTDYDLKDNYIKIIDTAENLEKINGIINVEMNGKDIAGLYHLVTREQEIADWLPVTSIIQADGQTYYKSIGQEDQYNIAFDSGVYSGTIVYGTAGTKKIAEKLKELGAGDKADKFADELEHFHSNGFSDEFERLTPYDSILDHIKLGQRRNIYLKITDDIVFELFPDDNDNENCRILVKDTQLTSLRSLVEFYRDNREMHDLYMDNHTQKAYYRINGLIVNWDESKTPGSKEPCASITILVDNEEWSDIIKWYTDYQLPGDLVPHKRIEFTENPIDFGDMTVYEEA